MPDPLSADELRAFRRTWRFTQAALAARLGVSVRAMEDWEGGRREPPAHLRLALSALVLGLAPWRALPLQVTQDGDGFRVRYEAQPGVTGEEVTRRVFQTRDMADAFAALWSGAGPRAIGASAS